jgi:hypothetical protein
MQNQLNNYVEMFHYFLIKLTYGFIESLWFLLWGLLFKWTKTFSILAKCDYFLCLLFLFQIVAALPNLILWQYFSQLDCNLDESYIHWFNLGLPLKFAVCENDMHSLEIIPWILNFDIFLNSDT